MRKIIIGTAIAVSALGFIPGEPGALVAPAEAIVGRPLTPVSVAGVARRTTRRAVVATSAATPTTVVVAAPAPTTTCTTSYDAYGNKITTCK
jgi:hypothetical protein